LLTLSGHKKKKTVARYLGGAAVFFCSSISYLNDAAIFEFGLSNEQ